MLAALSDEGRTAFRARGTLRPRQSVSLCPRHRARVTAGRGERDTGLGLTKKIPRAYSIAERGELFTDTACQARRDGMAEERRPAALRGSVIFLYSDDVARSRQFWGADLGLPVVAEKESVVFFKLPQAGGSLAVVKQGVSAAATPPVCARDAGKDVVMVCMLTDDVDGWSARMEGVGHRLEQPPRQNERFGIKNALLRSPEGYLVEIQQFLDPAEQTLFTT